MTSGSRLSLKSLFSQGRCVQFKLDTGETTGVRLERTAVYVSKHAEKQKAACAACVSRSSVELEVFLGMCELRLRRDGATASREISACVDDFVR